MAGSVQFVTRSRRVAHMPEWASEFNELVEHVSDSGLLAEVAHRLRFSYKRGFGMLDLAVFFAALACGNSKGGIRGFRTSIRAFAMRLVAIAGRHCVATSASVSPALDASDRIADLDNQVARLLGADAQVQELCRSPLVQARDAHGQAWPCSISTRVSRLCASARCPRTRTCHHRGDGLRHCARQAIRVVLAAKPRSA